MGTFTPVGSALPPRRNQLAITADAPSNAFSSSDWGESINIPAARDRMLEYFEREQLPGDVKQTLAAALNGDLHLQSLLFTAMLDTWPKLQKNIAEIARHVSIAPWKVVPFSIRGEKPDAAAEKLAKEVENLVWTMKPRAGRGENGLEGTIKSLVMGYYYGHTVAEMRWERRKDGAWKPRCTKPVPPRYYGYPYDWGQKDDPEDRLMFDPDGGLGARNFVDFPEHRFLIAIHRGHEGHAAVAAPLRALSGYWLAAVYGLKWFLNFTQLYGIPWRHAECEKPDENAVKAALASIGANGYIVTRPGAKINMVDAAKGGSSLPQKALIDLADQQCDQFILGQTLTGGTDNSGSRALGEVHQGTLDGVVDGVADFVGEILTHQFIPAIVAVNWGEDREDLPEMWAKREVARDEAALADRDEKLGITTGKVKVAESWFYERHGIPMPAAGDKLLIDEAVEPTPVPANQLPPPTGTKDPAVVTAGKKPVKAAAAEEWATFDSSLGIPRREMPQISSGDRSAMVQFLRARGIASQAETVDPSSLKATQVEYSPAMVDGAKKYTGGNRAILVSEDSYVVDGHHQWMAALEEEKPISVIRLMAPITRVLMMVHRMPSTSVAAADAAIHKDSLTVDQLSEAVLEGLTGVASEWLSPVRPVFERLAALAMSKNVTDDDFLAGLKKAQTELPELFDLLDTDALESAFENAISSAALAGSVSLYEP